MPQGIRGDGTESFLAGADLSTHQYHIVKLAAGPVVTVSGAGERSIGVLLNAPESGQVAKVMAAGGRCLVEACGGSVAIAAGDPLKADADGMAVKAATDKDKAFGIALEAASANNVRIACLVWPFDVAV